MASIPHLKSVLNFILPFGWMCDSISKFHVAQIARLLHSKVHPKFNSYSNASLYDTLKVLKVAFFNFFSCFSYQILLSLIVINTDLRLSRIHEALTTDKFQVQQIFKFFHVLLKHIEGCIFNVFSDVSSF